jgi:hypothetical protein
MSDDPGLVVVQATERFLALAATWLAWDGSPVVADGGMRVFTPHKAVRRYADHVIDHAAQVEALLAGVPPRANHWFESGVTVGADWARFTEVDLNEAVERLTRLATSFRLRLLAAGPSSWDVGRGEDWTLREIAVHVGDPWYAEQIGDLRVRPIPS